eukprot:gene5525-6883_t
METIITTNDHDDDAISSNISDDDDDDNNDKDSIVEPPNKNKEEGDNNNNKKEQDKIRLEYLLGLVSSGKPISNRERHELMVNFKITDLSIFRSKDNNETTTLSIQELKISDDDGDNSTDNSDDDDSSNSVKKAELKKRNQELIDHDFVDIVNNNDSNNNNNNKHDYVCDKCKWCDGYERGSMTNENNNSTDCKNYIDMEDHLRKRQKTLFSYRLWRLILPPSSYGPAVYRRSCVLGRLWFTIFAIGMVSMIILYILVIKIARYFIVSLSYVIVQSILNFTIFVYFSWALTDEQKKELQQYNYIYLVNLISFLTLLNAILHIGGVYIFGAPTQILFQNLMVASAATFLLIFNTYVSATDLQEIESKEERIRNLFNISSEALVLHKDGIILDANSTFERLFMVKLNSLLYPVPCGIWEFLPEIEKYFIDENTSKLLPPSFAHPLGQPADICIRYPIIVDTVAINSMGEEFSVHVRIEKNTNNGRLKEFDIVSITDTSARTKLINADLALRKAEEVNQGKINFLTTVSHEVRTPINGIVASLDILEKTVLDFTQREFLHCIKDCSNYLLDLISDILDFSKTEAGKMELEKDEFNLITMLEESMNIVYRTSSQKGIELVLQLEETLPVILIGDPYRIKQILLNFLSNAIKFTKKGQVIVGVKLCASDLKTNEYTIRFDVIDSGEGIKQEMLEHLFMAFNQVGTIKHQGTGLGLSISKKLCQLMGGEVFVQSQYGFGSTFSFSAKLPTPRENPVTIGSLGKQLSTYLSDHNTTTDPSALIKVPHSKIKGFVLESNSFVSQSVVSTFGLLQIEFQSLESLSQLEALFTTGIFSRDSSTSPRDESVAASSSSPNDQDFIYLIVVSELKNMHFFKECCASIPTKIYWILLSDNGVIGLQSIYSSVLRKPCDLPKVVDCLFFLEKVVIPQDLYYLLTNSTNYDDTQKNELQSQLDKQQQQQQSNTSTNNSGNNKYQSLTPQEPFKISKTLQKKRAGSHSRSSSYSDHVAITRGLIQVNRSPRPLGASSISTSTSVSSFTEEDVINIDDQNSSSTTIPINNNSNPNGNNSNTTTIIVTSPLSSSTPDANTNSKLLNQPDETVVVLSPPQKQKSQQQLTTSNQREILKQQSSKRKEEKPKEEGVKEIKIDIPKIEIGNNKEIELTIFSDNSEKVENNKDTNNIAINTPINESMSIIDINHLQQSNSSTNSSTNFSINSGINPQSTTTPTNNIRNSEDNNIVLPSLYSNKTINRGSDLELQKEDFSRKSRNSDQQVIEMKFIPTSPRISSFKILLVDDNTVNVKVFSKFLKDGGYSIDVAWNGIQALEAVSKYYYPIIFMDCHMDVMDGFTATKTIRDKEREILKKDPKYKKMTIIALTATDMSSCGGKDRCLECGMDAFIQKPVRNSKVMTSKIDQYLVDYSDDDIIYLTSMKRSFL